MGLDIKHMGGRVYLVGRRVIELDCDDIDPDTEAGMTEMRMHAETLFTSRFEKEPWPGLTVAVLLPKSASVDGDKHVLSMHHFKDCSEEVKTALRKEFPEHVGRF